ncbi:hypothetical protein N2603_36530 [Bradyrhizobium huanghuaihaiense]|uniref:hypothetical protein n=1 Tax=Bradyrhizobium huanghuaihaiense TaxID=990078 RepID=UPI0021AA1EF9|nr:hypothetical protein [Bradyrhizobium sp. CB3035]UWU75480.1 hypothetical protein N2603_36530 [Bradyrhizobium sp. CB3035]
MANSSSSLCSGSNAPLNRPFLFAGTPGGFWTWFSGKQQEDTAMTLGRGALLWLLGIPLPVILLLALFWR